MLNDPLADLLSVMKNAEAKGRKSCSVKPSSKVITRVLDIMNEKRFIGGYTVNEDGRGNTIQVNLIGAINDCGAIKPRFAVNMDDYEKFEKRFLPARGFGTLIVSTPKGIMTHADAKAKGFGGRLIAYCY